MNTKETRDHLGPHPGDDPIARLKHTLKAHDQTPGHAWAIDATTGIYHEGRTGLTFSDLSALETAIRKDEREKIIDQLRRSGHIRS